MSESTTPSDKKVPGAQPPWAPGNRAKQLSCGRCDIVAPLWFHPDAAYLLLCRHCSEVIYGPIVDV